MISSLFKTTGLICLSLLSSGCFQTAMFVKDYILTSPGMDKAVTSVFYTYHSVRGTHGLWLSNESGLPAHLDIEMLSFPHRQQWDELNMDTETGEALKAKTIRLLRNYFGSQKRIELITLKTVAPDRQEHNHLLDARSPEQMETLGEHMVSRGLYQVDTDLAKSSDYKHLLKLQNEAQRSRLGIWQYASVLNPNWHD
jgi:hypothetical protein